MSVTDNYEDIMKASWDDLPEVQVLPVGTYRLKAQQATYQKAKAADQSPKVLFPYAVKESLDDVDPDALEELGLDYDLTENRVFASFWVETAADWQKVRMHLGKHGIDTTGGKSLEDSFKEVKGSEIFAYLEQRNFTDNTGEVRTVNEPKNFASTED